MVVALAGNSLIYAIQFIKPCLTKCRYRAECVAMEKITYNGCGFGEVAEPKAKLKNKS